MERASTVLQDDKLA